MFKELKRCLIKMKRRYFGHFPKFGVTRYYIAFRKDGPAIVYSNPEDAKHDMALNGYSRVLTVIVESRL